METVSNKQSEIPWSVSFFSNGMAAVGDINGQQIPKYQGRHADVVGALAADGYDWRKLPDVWGFPKY